MLHWQSGGAIKIVLQHHAERPFKDSIRAFIQRWADRYISAYLFASFDLAQDWLAKEQIRDASKIKEVLAVSSPFYPIDKTTARQQTKALGDHVFIWVGDLNENKDPLTTIKAFMRFAALHAGVSLYMIYPTEALLPQLNATMKDVRESERIFLVGEVKNDDLLHWYNSADFIISSSHYESAGIAVCEALSCGCIPILTAIPSFRMMTQNGEVGVLFEPGNEASLCSALEKGLAFNRSEAARKVLARFKGALSNEAIAKKTIQLLQEEIS